ncbi:MULTISPECIES: O-antigen translocase [Francisella]|uniref:O-antigen translocase n=1 Tax=Francisella opportunistica TaxID=2016517 RepID=A0A345JQ21_9GAMM|nr:MULTISPECIES: O-antigen translocase [Francisella]APC91106.1 O antigen flippase [Francisella sp. MA067296]AXH29417.1 O-antigen translocase [Francisella opportunistica]AXH31069.1 O-antigen translocase [Francisella opportunistica]AXH32714.1 O-antigen translocase [Francisella opportunistica]
MNLWKTSFFTIIATLATLVSTFVVAKFIAIFAGAAAFGLFGQFISFVNIMQIGSGGIVQTGVVKYIAEYKNDENSKDRIISTATSLVTVFSLVSGVIVAIFSQQLSQLVLGTSSYYWLFICFGLTLYGYVMSQLIRSIFNGLNKMKEYATFSVISSIISVLVIPILAYFYQTNGVLLGFVLGQALLFIVVLIFTKITKIKLFLLEIKLRNPWTKKLLIFSIMSVVSGLSLPLAQIFLRNYVAEHSNWTDVGYWQAILRISDAYLLLITTVISTYALPKYSSVKCNQELRKEVFYLLKVIVPIVFFMALCIYLLRHLVIVILFSKSFMPMENLFHFQLLGDVIKIAAWIVANTFLAKAAVKIFIVLEIGFTLSFVVLSIIFFNMYGLHGLTIGFFVNYIMYFTTCLIIFLYKFREEGK